MANLYIENATKDWFVFPRILTDADCLLLKEMEFSANSLLEADNPTPEFARYLKNECRLLLNTLISKGQLGIFINQMSLKVACSWHINELAGQPVHEAMTKARSQILYAGNPNYGSTLYH